MILLTIKVPKCLLIQKSQTFFYDVDFCRCYSMSVLFQICVLVNFCVICFIAISGHRSYMLRAPLNCNNITGCMPLLPNFSGPHRAIGRVCVPVCVRTMNWLHLLLNNKSNQIKSNLFAMNKVHNITVHKNYISLGWTNRRQLRTYVCP